MDKNVLKAHAKVLFLKEKDLKTKIKAEGKKIDENKKNPNIIKKQAFTPQKKTATKKRKIPLIENPISMEIIPIEPPFIIEILYFTLKKKTENK